MATIASPKARETYFNLPPPPLPEFYLLKGESGNNDGSNTSSASACNAQALVKMKTEVRHSKQKTQTVLPYIQQPTRYNKDAAVAKLPPMPGDGTDEIMRVTYSTQRTTSAPVVTFAPPPLDIDDVPPLAVYHICRICLRPRSARFHREHPIPINGVPPPPGICRRCRVSTVEEVSKVATVVEECESNKMKLGIACIIPEEDYVSNKEMRERRGGRAMPSVCQLLTPVTRPLLRESSESESTGREREIVYRHVCVRESTSSPPPLVRTSVKSTAQDAIDAVSVRSQDAMMTTAIAASSRVDAQAPHKAQSVSMRSQATTRNTTDDIGFRQVGQGVITTNPRQDPSKASDNTRSVAYAASACSQTASTHSPSKAVARASAFIAQPARPERTEAEIRRIAREEVIRYRQAERKLEAHSNPYAHGRMVPVERRIEKQADVVEPMPWERRNDKVEEVVMTRKQGRAKGFEAQLEKPARPPEAEKSASRVEPGSGTAPSKPAERHEDSARPKQTGDRANADRYNDHEYVTERVSRADSKISVSGYTSGSGWVSEKVAGFERQSRAPKTTRTEPRSERSERRKWDMMTETTTQQAKTSPFAETDRTESRSTRSDRRKWDLMTESGKTTVNPERAPPESVKPHETYGWEGERRGYDKREIWLPPSGNYEVIEVIEETELSPERRKPPSRRESAMPNRILELKEDAKRQEKGPSQASEQGDWQGMASTKSSDRDHWRDESGVRAASVASSKYQQQEVRYRKDEVRNELKRGPPSLSERSFKAPESGRSSSRRDRGEAAEEPRGRNGKAPDSEGPGSHRTTAEPVVEEPLERTRPRAFDLRWAAAAAPATRNQDPQRKKVDEAWQSKPPQTDADSDKTKYPALTPSAPGSRAGRSDTGTERTKASAAQTSAHDSRSARSPEREYIFTERIIEPANQRWDSERFFARPSRHYVETRGYYSTCKGSKAGSKVPSNANSKSEPVPMSQAGSKAPSKTGSAQPGSQVPRHEPAVYQEARVGDDSEHSTGRVRFASKVDVSPTPPDSEASSTLFHIIGARPSSRRKMAGGESGEDLIAEYEERRGRSRARDRAPSAAEGPEYFYERKEVERTMPQNDGAGRSDRGDGIYRSSDPKPLARAFSESPSRELFHDMPACEKQDGVGPYRPDMPRPDSMAPQNGSGHGNIGEDRRYGHAHGRWPEDLSIPEDHVR